jgi:hypothetical protein
LAPAIDGIVVASAKTFRAISDLTGIFRAASVGRLRHFEIFVRTDARRRHDPLLTLPVPRFKPLYAAAVVATLRYGSRIVRAFAVLGLLHEPKYGGRAFPACALSIAIIVLSLAIFELAAGIVAVPHFDAVLRFYDEHLSPGTKVFALLPIA